MAGVGGDTKDHGVPAPLPQAGHQPPGLVLAQVAQSPIQPCSLPQSLVTHGGVALSAVRSMELTDLILFLAELGCSSEVQEACMSPRAGGASQALNLLAWRFCHRNSDLAHSGCRLARHFASHALGFSFSVRCSDG